MVVHITFNCWKCNPRVSFVPALLSPELPFPFLLYLFYSRRTYINDSTERPTAVNIGKSREGEISCFAIPFQGPSTNVDKDLGIITASCVSLLFNSGNHFHQVVHVQLLNPSCFSAWPIMIHHWSDQFKLEELAKIYICPAYLDFLSGVRSGLIFTRQWRRTRSGYNQITVTAIAWNAVAVQEGTNNMQE